MIFIQPKSRTYSWQTWGTELALLCWQVPPFLPSALSQLWVLQLRLLPHLVPLPLCSQFPKGSQTRSVSHLMDGYCKNSMSVWQLGSEQVRGQTAVLCRISRYSEEDWACEANMSDGAVLYWGTLMYDTASGCDWHWHCQRISLSLNQCAVTLIILFNSAYYQFNPWSKFMAWEHFKILN